jgi:excisionase family DNA binding protein
MYRSDYCEYLHKEKRSIMELLTIDEVAKILRCDPTTTRRWIKNGAMEAVTLPHVGKRQVYHVRRETLDKILAGIATPAV